MTVLQTGTTGLTVHHQAQDKRALNQTRWETVTTERQPEGDVSHMTVLQTGTVTGVTVHHQAQDKRALNQTRWETVTI